jgi:hypothetical protein
MKRPFPPLPVRVVACLGLLLAALLTASGAERSFVPGKSYFGRSNYVEYIAGDLPVIIAAPHGGREKPENLPDRIVGTFAFDTNTQELAREIAAEFKRRTGHTPHVVICRLYRRKVDCNRDLKEGAAGHPLATIAWNDFQTFAANARSNVVVKFGKGFFIDLHGHGHKEQRLEFGYLHGSETLSKSDAELNAPEVITESSLRAIAGNSKLPYAELLRGPRSLGALMETNGFPSAPSPSKPSPGAPYFRGGYNTIIHGRDAAPFVGVQIETNYKGVRDNATSRKKFAAALHQSLEVFLAEQMGLTLPKAKSRESQ